MTSSPSTKSISETLRGLGLRIANSQFARHVFVVMSGTVLAQAIPILISPLLTRLYSPAEFGLFALYSAIGSVVAVAASGRYELAILLPEKDEDALNILFLALTISLAVSALSVPVVFLLHERILSLAKNRDLSPWLYSLPVFILSSQLYLSFYYWWNRQKAFKKISMSRVLQSVLAAAISIGLGLTEWKSGGLIVGVLGGQLIAGFVLAALAWRQTRGFQGLSADVMKAQAKRYVGFAKYSVPADFINTVSNQVPMVLLSSFFGTAVTGYFSLTQRVLGAPISVIANSVLDVFKQRASSDYAKLGNCSKIYDDTLKHLLALSVLPFAALFLLAPYAFAFVFGAEWREAGEYARLLAPLFLLRFTANPLSYVLYIAEKQKYDLAWQVGLFFATTGAIVAGHWMNSAHWSIGLFSLAYGFMYLIYLRLSYKAARGTTTDARVTA